MQTGLLLKALILGIVEGLTEFLPISSTGHLIIAAQLLDFHDEKGKLFEIVIQTGAMLAVFWEYRARILGALKGLRAEPEAQRFVLNLIVAFMPAALLGLAFGGLIKARLFHAIPVALAFVVGGLIILWVERRRRCATIDEVGRMTWQDALKVGIAQAFALIPGTSRSGATIIGGMLFGLSRRTATEFSFFLALPTLGIAAAYDLYKHRDLLSAADVPAFGVGFVAAFLSAFLCVRWLIRYVSTHDFSLFAWYRIGFGFVVLMTAYTGLVAWTSR
jgi:undecaprenyl-diphosphatase